jgi:O-antigen/teichoic acid export membrane protein
MIVMLRSRARRLSADRSFAEILRGSVYAMAARVGATALGLAASVIVARLYGADVMGIVAVVDSTLMMVTVLTVLGTGTSILRLIPEHISKYSAASAFRVYRKTQYFVGILSALTGCALFVSSGLLATTVFGKPGLAFVFALAAPFIVAKSLMLLNTQAVRGLRLIKTFAFMQTLPALSTLLLLIVATLLVDNRRVPIYAHLAGGAVTALAGAWIMNRTFKQRMRPGDIVHAMPVRAIVDISMPMLISGLTYSVIAQMGIMMLGAFRSEAEVGYYAIAVKLAGLSAFLLTAINTMAAPKFSELFHAGRTDEALRVARKSTRLMVWTNAPVLVGLVVLGKPGIDWVFGQAFTAAYPAMVVLALGQLVNSAAGSAGIFLNMTGHERALRNIMLGAASLNVLLNVTLIPRFGIEGAAVAAMATTVAWNVGALLYIKAKFGRTPGYFPLPMLG